MNIPTQHCLQVRSRVLSGLEAVPVTIEACTAQTAAAPELDHRDWRWREDGEQPRICARIEGWPEALAQEAIAQIYAGICSAGLRFPTQPCVLRVCQSHMPGDKTLYLPLAIAILAVSGQLDEEQFLNCEFYGELTHDGQIELPYRMPLLTHLACSRYGGLRRAVLPPDPSDLYSYVDNCAPFVVSHLAELYLKLRRGDAADYSVHTAPEVTAADEYADLGYFHTGVGFTDTLVVAAAGGHPLIVDEQTELYAVADNIAACLRTLLPPLDKREALLLMRIACSSGEEMRELRNASQHYWGERRLVSVYLCADEYLLGNERQAGKLSIAHRGIAIVSAQALMKLSDTGWQKLLEAWHSGELRWPSGNGEVQMPAQAQLLIRWSNKGLCPCGHLDREGEFCRCTPTQIAEYQAAAMRMPIRERCALRITLDGGVVHTNQKCRSTRSADYLPNIIRARARQMKRGLLNAQLRPEHLQTLRLISDAAEALLTAALPQASADYLHALRTVALTFADLEDGKCASEAHMKRALSLCDIAIPA